MSIGYQSLTTLKEERKPCCSSHPATIARAREPVRRLDVVGERHRRGRAVGPEPREAHGVHAAIQQRVGKRDLHEVGPGGLEWPCRKRRRALPLDQPAAHAELH